MIPRSAHALVTPAIAAMTPAQYDTAVALGPNLHGAGEHAEAMQSGGVPLGPALRNEVPGLPKPETCGSRSTVHCQRGDPLSIRGEIGRVGRKHRIWPIDIVVSVLCFASCASVNTGVRPEPWKQRTRRIVERPLCAFLGTSRFPSCSTPIRE